MRIKDCKLIELTRIQDQRGNLSVVEGGRDIPFEIRRAYYLYDIPGGAVRAGHGHKKLHQLMIAMSGAFDVTLDDGTEKRRFHLNRSYFGLYIPPMIWRDLDNFSSGAVCLNLASEHYDESDYMRSYEDFLAEVKAREAR
jgi:dTDP-4-dehydrorhamnose 3,5-epimerase-like enzyme